MADTTQNPQDSEPKKGLFGSKPPAPEPSPASRFAEDLTSMAGRLKVSEERYNDLRKKILLIEQNMISNHKKSMNEIKMIDSDIAELNNKINLIEERMMLIVKELKLTAKKEDVDVMKRYVELWNPMRFATKEQVEKMINENLDIKEEPKKE